MWMMLQQEQPDDYVIASGESNSVKEFTKQAFALLGLDYQEYVVEDPALFRPAEIHELIGDSSKAERVLGWRPEISFNELLREMVDSDMKIEQARSSHK
jgi:GDPmannose 4,6-dehydratase